MTIKVKNLLIIIILCAIGYAIYRQRAQKYVTLEELAEYVAQGDSSISRGTISTSTKQSEQDQSSQKSTKEQQMDRMLEEFFTPQKVTEKDTANFKTSLDIVDVPLDDQQFVRENPNKRMELPFTIYIPTKALEGIPVFRPSLSSAFQYGKHVFYMTFRASNSNNIMVEQYSWPEIKKELGDINKVRSITYEGKKVYLPDGYIITDPRPRYVQGAKAILGETYISLAYTGDDKLGDTDLAEIITSFVK